MLACKMVMGMEVVVKGKHKKGIKKRAASSR